MRTHSQWYTKQASTDLKNKNQYHRHQHHHQRRIELLSLQRSGLCARMAGLLQGTFVLIENFIRNYIDLHLTAFTTQYFLYNDLTFAYTTKVTEVLVGGLPEDEVDVKMSCNEARPSSMLFLAEHIQSNERKCNVEMTSKHLPNYLESYSLNLGDVSPFGTSHHVHNGANSLNNAKGEFSEEFCLRQQLEITTAAKR